MGLAEVHEKVKAEHAGGGVAAGNGARVLTIDIECAPAVAHVWGLWDQNVAVNQIVEDGRMICFAAKWYGEDQTLFFSEARHGRAGMVEAAWRLLDEADVVVTYNGVNYDNKHLNREFVLAGLARPRPWKNVDLLRVVRQRFKFPSNKLDYVADRLGVGRKVAHEGHDLWTACMAGDEDAWRRMEAYNRGDVELTERLFDRLRGWLGSGANLGLWAGEEASCPECGGAACVPAGEVATAVSLYEALRCVACGAVFRTGVLLRRVAARPAV